MAVTDATAFLVHEKIIYYTRADVVPSPAHPYTPLAALIEGIWNVNPEFANKILRNHLYSYYLRTPLCDGMIKVAAKRARLMTEFESYDFMEELTDQKWVEVFPWVSPKLDDAEKWIGKTISHSEAIDLVRSLAQKSDRKENLPESDRPVGGILLSKENEVLSVGWNTNAKQRVHHCEVNLIRNYMIRTGQKIPTNSTLLVSLKPCAMCAAQLLTFSEDFNSLRVLYLEDDPGPASANSVLMRGSDLAKKAKVNHTKNFLIRRARVEDARAIHDVHMRSIQKVCSKDHSPEEVKAWGGREFDSAWRLSGIENEWCWVMEHQNQVHGYAQLNHVANEPEHGYLAALYFDEVGSNTGMGSWMLTLMLQEALKIGMKKLSLHSTLTAHAFYQKFGFTDTGPLGTMAINGQEVRSYPMQITLNK